MEVILVKGQIRKDLGKRASKLLRREEMIPCVLYGGDVVEHFHAPYNSFRHLVYTDQFIKADLDLEGKHYTAIIKDIQFHPVTDRISHIDFVELTAGKKVNTELPVNLTGFAVGVKDGGVLQLKMRKLAISALPKDLPESVILDVTDLEMGKSIKVGDISIPGVEILNSESIPVVGVVIPRALKGGGGAAEGEEGEGVEGEGEGEGAAATPAEGADQGKSE